LLRNGERVYERLISTLDPELFQRVRRRMESGNRLHLKVDVCQCPADYHRTVTTKLRLRGAWFELLVLILAALEVASLLGGDESPRPAVIAITAASVLVLLGWRWYPLVSCATGFALIAVAVAMMPQFTLVQFAGTLVTFAVAGAVNIERDAVLAWCAGAGMLAYAAWGDPFGGGFPDWALSLAFGTALWCAGLLVARRGRQAHLIEQRADDAIRDREQRTRQAVSGERARIARELHDVVSHGLSVVIIQTQAARAALTDKPSTDHGETDQIIGRRLGAVESSARDALTEMRRMLGLLGSDFDPMTNSAPVVARPLSPDLSQIDALIERAGAAGIEVEPVCLSGNLENLPAGLNLVAYRIVQEALTNVVKHAPGASVEIELRWQGSEVAIEVTNTGGNSAQARDGDDLVKGGGRGLVGMRERVALYGGQFNAGPQSGGGYKVSATLEVRDDTDDTTTEDSHDTEVGSR
jgi:signal transduction histidine kinase